ncbi:beta-ketoacyl-[acyl-carrier-protein] synthase family protein [Calycomorphotria hydatis]|uniref:beta-ketoacyl-[acyl-carrier-protein] synthase family protein n=1 Tax=Calycomorphotria hydatis TaxID=2528027 RepID=UPI001E53FC59|nr:beta-ketoacyl-[acyl-carrier-protein] synthase family protein [Calycomorphotria hydatis]
MCHDEIVITGVGCVSPLGLDLESSWKRLLAAESATRRLTEWSSTSVKTSVDPTLYFGAPHSLSPSNSRSDDPIIGLALSATEQALNSAEFSDDHCHPERRGCVFGTSKGAVWQQTEMFESFRQQEFLSGEDSSFDFINDLFATAPAQAIGRRWNFRGCSLSPVAACATGVVSLIRAAELLHSGQCDMVLAGAADASLHPAILASFSRLGVLSTNDDEDPSRLCRPFDRHRDGFVVGEGAAAFVLERAEHALARGAQPLAVWNGGMIFSDPTAILQMDSSGEIIRELIERTLRQTDVSAKQIGHLNLHGTATAQNDVVEAAAVQAAFGELTEDLPCSALKGAIGHLLGAAGAVELAFLIASLQDQVIPPTVNLNDPDPACVLSLRRAEPQVCEIHHAMKLSYGFGGTMASAVISKP